MPQTCLNHNAIDCKLTDHANTPEFVKVAHKSLKHIIYISVK
jgi:hypothetical protein